VNDNPSDKLIASGRVASLDLSYNGATRVTINIGEFSTLSEIPINGTLYVDGQPDDNPWQLGQMVTITIERG
jgi:hypothetical protein